MPQFVRTNTGHTSKPNTSYSIMILTRKQYVHFVHITSGWISVRRMTIHGYPSSHLPVSCVLRAEGIICRERVAYQIERTNCTQIRIECMRFFRVDPSSSFSFFFIALGALNAHEDDGIFFNSFMRSIWFNGQAMNLIKANATFNSYRRLMEHGPGDLKRWTVVSGFVPQ